MKLSILAVVSSVLGLASAFAPSTTTTQKVTALNAEQQSRKTFFNSVAAFGAASILPSIANAGSMAQENVFDPTEQWETGKPTAAAEKLRMGRYTNARTQLTSNFAPQKRLTLERKSPVTRLDINAPDFTAYKKTFPGLYKTVDKK
eukprot:CAMPEP_0172487558 /NCGR_PEP_ID=MMETSP1066-20121228/16703_1 /TAXON_ID=671091 /ORGANISM="Coscinodiscus wailesii, Strain CCMP2513" /LENGTH=145 /DNA_ID=CAMNT_0013254255 /DNA_START=74 /DNA_END=511 /DNA_ORIENTATION=-